MKINTQIPNQGFLELRPDKIKGSVQPVELLPPGTNFEFEEFFIKAYQEFLTKFPHFPPLSTSPSYVGTFYLPIGLNLEQLLKTNNKKNKFLFHYAFIISSIYLSRVKDRSNKKTDFVPLNFKVLIQIISKRKIKEIMGDLLAWKIIECDGVFAKGYKSKGYRLTEPYLSQVYKKIKVTDKLINKKIEQWRLQQVEKAKAAGEDYAHLINYLKKITIDYNAAMDYLNKNYSPDSFDYSARQSSVELIHNREFFYVVDKKGKRLHTNLTNLSADLRKFVRYDGLTLTQVDIKNSQPFLLNLIIKDMINQDKPEEVAEYKLYKKITQEGKFYEFLGDKFGLGEFDDTRRQEFKKLFFGRVFFDVNRAELKKEEKLFSELFPNIFRFIRELKAKDYTQLAIRLQRSESTVIINECVRKIRTEKPEIFVGTIHDSIVCTPSNLVYVKQVMVDVFELKHNLRPGLKMEMF